jgi:TolB-like protein
MVVTDLAQSPDLESTDRRSRFIGAQTSERRGHLVRHRAELARRAGVKHVLLGNYVKSGDAIRINITLQEVESGKI